MGGRRSGNSVSYKSLILISIALSAIVTRSIAAPVIDEAASKRIDALVGDAISARKAPSCCVVIGSAESILFSKAYGHFTYDSNSPAVTLDSIYDLASCSKPTGTATALALLLQEGKVKLEDMVSKYLSTWDQEDKREINILNLATHTSGLPAYTSVECAKKAKEKDDSNADGLTKCIASLSLKYETNKGHTYSCLNYLTLARVNEEAAKMTQEAYLRERVWEPLQMNNTAYHLSTEQIKQCAPTLKTRQGEVHDPLAYYYIDNNHCSGNAGLFSSANDLSKFCSMLLNNGRFVDRDALKQQRIFKPEIVDMFFTNLAPKESKTAWTLGWGITDDNRYPTPDKRGPDSAAIAHSGYTGTAIEIDRFAGVYIIILTNRVYPNDNTSIASIRTGVRKVVIDSDPVYAAAKEQSKEEKD